MIILFNFRPGLSASVSCRDIAVQSLHAMPNNPDHFLVCVKSPQAFVMTAQGQVIKTLSSGKVSGGDFVCATVSPQGLWAVLVANAFQLPVFIVMPGKWIYCVGEDGILYAFDSSSGQLESVLEISDREVIGVCHHPHRNLITTITENGELKMWKP